MHHGALGIVFFRTALIPNWFSAPVGSLVQLSTSFIQAHNAQILWKLFLCNGWMLEVFSIADISSTQASLVHSLGHAVMQTTLVEDMAFHCNHRDKLWNLKLTYSTQGTSPTLDGDQAVSAKHREQNIFNKILQRNGRVQDQLCTDVAFGLSKQRSTVWCWNSKAKF